MKRETEMVGELLSVPLLQSFGVVLQRELRRQRRREAEEKSREIDREKGGRREGEEGSDLVECEKAGEYKTRKKAPSWHV